MPNQLSSDGTVVELTREEFDLLIEISGKISPMQVELVFANDPQKEWKSDRIYEMYKELVGQKVLPMET